MSRNGSDSTGDQRRRIAARMLADRRRGRRSEPAASRVETARGCNSMVEYLPSKQATWVRFPSPALGGAADARAATRAIASRDEPDRRDESRRSTHAAVAQLVERVLGKDEVLGSNPSGSFWVGCPTFGRDAMTWPSGWPRPLGWPSEMDHGWRVGRLGGFPPN